MKISWFIILSFFLILLLFSITTYMISRQAKAVKENAEYVARSGQIIRNTARFQRNILSMVSGLRGYLLTGEKYFTESYDTAAVDNEVILGELAQLIPDTSSQKARLLELQALNNEWIDDFAEPLRQAKTLAIVNDSNLEYFKATYREKIVTGEERKIQRELQEKFKRFSNYEYEYREQRRTSLAKTVQSTSNVSYYLTIASVVLSLAIVGFLAYRITGRIGVMVRLAGDISAGNYQVRIEDKSRDELSKLSGSLNSMAEALQGNIALLEAKNRELDQFAHIVSHDLKGPLRGIDNVVSWMEEDHADEISPQVSEYLQLIKGRVVRAENLIQGILSYARIDKEVLHKEPVNVTQLIGEILENLNPEKKIVFSVQQDMPDIYTERLPLYQVFYNLVSNAIKYHHKEDGEVKIYYQDWESYYEFFVEDDGPGIARHHQERIFTIFQTLKDRDSFESTGVGLAIVKKVLDGRKETIRLVSEPGKGSMFSFTWLKSE
jgi:signal transduction histidine kinase